MSSPAHTGGRRRRNHAVIGLLVFAAILHLPAYAVVARYVDLRFPLDPSSLIVLTAWMGGYAIAFGAFMLILAFRLRSRHTGSAGRAV